MVETYLSASTDIWEVLQDFSLHKCLLRRRQRYINRRSRKSVQ